MQFIQVSVGAETTYYNVDSIVSINIEQSYGRCEVSFSNGNVQTFTGSIADRFIELAKESKQG